MTNKENRLQLVIDNKLRDQVNAWRRNQDDIPNVSESIRRLIREGLKHGGTGD